MKHRWISLLIVFALALSLLSGVGAAADPVRTTGAYYLDKTLYVFAWFPGFEDEGKETKAGLLVNNVQVGEQVEGERIAYTGERAQYMLLIDNSTSMNVYADRIQAVAASMLATEKDISVSIATFGKEFHVLEEGITRADDAKRVISGLRYDEQGTDISGGVIHAVDYVIENGWTVGTLSNIILLTDGVPYYARDPEKEAESEELAANALTKVLAETPQVFVHTICFDAWEEKTYEALRSGEGMDLSVGDTAKAGEAGTQLVEWYTSLYSLVFPLQNYSDDLGLRIASMQMASIRRVADLTRREPPEKRLPLPGVLDSESDEGQEPDEPTESDEPPAEENPPEDPEKPIGEAEPDEPEPEPEPEKPVEDEPEPENDEPAEPEPEPDEPEDGKEPDESGEPEPEDPDDTAETGKEQPEDKGKFEGKGTQKTGTEPDAEKTVFGLSLPGFILIAAGAALLIAAIVVLIVLLSKKGKKGTSAPRTAAPKRSATPSPDALPIRAELRFGSIQGGNTQLWLSDQLMIGTDPRCDVVLLDNMAAPLHARIFRENGQIFIEDLNSPTGTLIGGMRIYTHNPLRPGDEIQFGNTGIAFWF